MRTRLAPTPSGYLHAGNAVNFLITHALARRQGGRLLLRIDDLDVDRSRPEYIEDIFASLQWLGIEWDEGPRDAAAFARHWSQRHRIALYHRALDDLRQGGQFYACSCSRAHLAGCRCRDDRNDLEAPGMTWRLKVPENCAVTIAQWPRGTATIDLARAMPDPVLRKRNGDPAYQIASLCDDVDHGIDLIVRGEDLLPSTACQMYLAGLLELPVFQRTRFVHHELVTDPGGVKLSKSAGVSSLRAMREAGKRPEDFQAVAAHMLAAITG